jgi:hypothetical protein
MKIRTIIQRRKKALKTASPKRRDKLRHQYHVALKLQQLRKECAA